MEENENLNVINEENKPLKILLLGKAGVGKTSIKNIIFEKKAPQDTLKLCPTNEIEESHLYLLKKIPISILDCCSKDDVIKTYFTSRKQIIFSNVTILIFVIELQNKNKKESDDEVSFFEK